MRRAEVPRVPGRAGVAAGCRLLEHELLASPHSERDPARAPVFLPALFSIGLRAEAKLSNRKTTEQTRTEMQRIVSDEVFPALREEPGFAGALSLVNSGTGEAVIILLWHSAEQAQRPLGDNGMNVQSTSVWEVVVRV
jgi:hypothetical protein